MLKTAMTWSRWRWEGIVTLIASRRGVSSHVLLHLRNAVNMGGGLFFFLWDFKAVDGCGFDYLSVLLLVRRVIDIVFFLCKASLMLIMTAFMNFVLTCH